MTHDPAHLPAICCATSPCLLSLCLGCWLCVCWYIVGLAVPVLFCLLLVSLLKCITVVTYAGQGGAAVCRDSVHQSGHARCLHLPSACATAAIGLAGCPHPGHPLTPLHPLPLLLLYARIMQELCYCTLLRFKAKHGSSAVSCLG